MIFIKKTFFGIKKEQKEIKMEIKSFFRGGVNVKNGADFLTDYVLCDKLLMDNQSYLVLD